MNKIRERIKFREEVNKIRKGWIKLERTEWLNSVNGVKLNSVNGVNKFGVNSVEGVNKIRWVNKMSEIWLSDESDEDESGISSLSPKTILIRKISGETLFFLEGLAKDSLWFQ